MTDPTFLIGLALCLILEGPLTIVGAVIFLALKRNGAAASFSLRDLLRLYLNLMALLTLFMTAIGLSTLLTAGLTTVAGKEFSYQSYSAPTPPPEAPKEWGGPSGTDNEKRLENAFKTDLIRGSSLAGVGLLLWAIHSLLLRGYMGREERGQSVLWKSFRILTVILFAVVSLVAIPMAIYEGLRYNIIEPLGYEPKAAPGGIIAAAIVFTPIWLYYLIAQLMEGRRGQVLTVAPAPEPPPPPVAELEA